MHFDRWQKIRLLALVGVGSLLIGLKWLEAHRARVPMVSAAEMATRVPDFKQGLALPGSEAPARLIREALEDARRSGFDCTYWHTVRCPQSACCVWVLTVKGVSDTQLLYRTDGENTRLLEKCEWGVYQGWPPAALADRERLARELREREARGGGG